MTRTVGDMLEAARARLRRVDPHEVAAAAAAGALLVDTRPGWQRAQEGELPGALLIERNHAERDIYVAECVTVVRLAREAPGCLAFVLTADPIEPDRVNVFERWESDAHLERFRGSGPDPGRAARIRDAQVATYRISATESRRPIKSVPTAGPPAIRASAEVSPAPVDPVGQAAGAFQERPQQLGTDEDGPRASVINRRDAGE